MKEMEVMGRITVRRDGRTAEGSALFDTGATRSYLSKEFAEKVGYERYSEPRRVALAVKGKETMVIGWTVVDVEIDGWELPEKEAFGVVEDLRIDAIIGLNIMESYGIFIEDNRLKLRHYPPISSII